jgi:hypothetical protein
MTAEVFRSDFGMNPLAMRGLGGAMDDAELLPVHEVLVGAEADWAARLEAAAEAALSAMPERPEGLDDLVERYVPSVETRVIASFLFMLRACRVDDGAAVQRLAELHDAQMDGWLNDPGRLRKWGRKEEAIREAKFGTGETLRSMVYSFRPTPARGIGLDAQAFGRFLVEFKNKAQIREALVLLAHLGFFTTERVGPRSNLYVTTGRLEDLYAAHLAAIRSRFEGLRDG